MHKILEYSACNRKQTSLKPDKSLHRYIHEYSALVLNTYLAHFINYPTGLQQNLMESFIIKRRCTFTLFKSYIFHRFYSVNVTSGKDNIMYNIRNAMLSIFQCLLHEHKSG